MQYLLGSLQQLSRMLTAAGRRDVSSAAAVLSPGWCPPPGSAQSIIPSSSVCCHLGVENTNILLLDPANIVTLAMTHTSDPAEVARWPGQVTTHGEVRGGTT